MSGSFANLHCFIHKGPFSYSGDLERIPSILIDPDTGMPPHVTQGTAGHVESIPLTLEERAEAAKRCIRKPVCRPCAEHINKACASRGKPPKFDISRYDSLEAT